MSLTDRAIRSVKHSTKPQKLFDSRGLYLLVSPNGSKRWRIKYHYAKKEKLLSLGEYPLVSLAEAREARDQLRKQLADGRDPAAIRKAERAGGPGQTLPTFLVVATEWYEQRKERWTADHGSRLFSRLEQHVFPWIGTRPVAEISAMELLAVLQRMQQQGILESAHRALNTCSQIFRFAAVTGRAARDITTDLRGALPPPPIRHRAAVVDHVRLAPLLRTLLGYPGSLVVRSAIHFGLLTFVRPGELRTARWCDIDLASHVWTFTASKTKTPHVVPLARQAVHLLTELHALTGDGEYVFPCARTKKRPMSNNAVLAAMRSLQISNDELCGHGFRAIARTLLCEDLGFRAELVEHQLAHSVRDPLGRAYNRTQFLTERRIMMQQWADHIDQLANVEPTPIALVRAA
jgi:integrase